jgi:hypothetical protein
VSNTQISKVKRMTEPLCSDNKFYDYTCQVILLALYFNKQCKHTKLIELRNTVDDVLRLQSKSPLDDDTWKACMKILTDKGLIATWS